MGNIVLDGAIDLHCHYGPESIVTPAIGAPHSVDAMEAATDAAAVGFGAIVLKSHDFPSNAVAYTVGRAVPGVRVYGSVCCDFCIGGLNPEAVEVALRDGAAVVWLPTISSQQDIDNGIAAVMRLTGPGIRLLDDAGRLRPEVHEILDLVAEHDAVAATGHTSRAEHYALADRFARRGRLVVTHAMNPGPGPHLSPDECAELAARGAHIELSAATCMGSDGPSVADVAEAIGKVGPEMVVLSTDYGWTDKLPRPAAGLQSYVDALWAAGVAEGALRRMVCENPARLLKLVG
ncbi:MAG TPA: DUF6282 family protein [Acidimicrobiales bacterium]|nr:DUF6282 family protein [Acidimicrobiales bacterium]